MPSASSVPPLSTRKVAPPYGSPDHARPMTTLDLCAVGSRLRVVDVEGEPFVARRLMEMGLVPGTVVEVLRQAPLGDPIEIRLRGYRLTLRRTESALVRVLPS